MRHTLQQASDSLGGKDLQRGVLRVAVQIPARMILPETIGYCNLSITSLSGTGAQLETPYWVAIPQRVSILVRFLPGQPASRIECEPSWQRGNAVGVRFVGTIPAIVGDVVHALAHEAGFRDAHHRDGP